MVALAVPPGCGPQQVAVSDNFGKVPCQIVESSGYIPPPVALPPEACEQRKREAQATAIRAAQMRAAHPEPPTYQPNWEKVEAENGQACSIDLNSIRAESTGAGATIYVHERGPDPVNLRNVIFQCPDYMITLTDHRPTPATYLPPRSIGRRLADIACAGKLRHQRSSLCRAVSRHHARRPNRMSQQHQSVEQHAKRAPGSEEERDDF